MRSGLVPAAAAQVKCACVNTRALWRQPLWILPSSSRVLADDRTRLSQLAPPNGTDESK